MQVLLDNVPKNAGQRAFYVLSVAPLANVNIGSAAAASASIFFPQQFSASVGGADADDALACGVVQTQTLDQSWHDYKSLLALSTSDGSAPVTLVTSSSQQSTSSTVTLTYTPIKCTVPASRVLAAPMPPGYNASLWTHFLLANVINPPAYDATDEFQIAVQDGNSATLWLFSGHLVYFLSQAPQLVALQRVAPASANVRVATNYSVALQVPAPGGFAPLANVQLLVSVRLPLAAYAAVLPYQRLQTLSCWAQLGNQVYYAQCALYGAEILLYGVTLNANTGTATALTLNIDNLVNPTAATSLCASVAAGTGGFFDVRLIDAIARNVLQQSSLGAAAALPPCLHFVNALYDVTVSGPTVLMAGISYTYTVQLERAADALTITPSASAPGVQFAPQVIAFTDFSQGTTAQVMVQVLPSVAAGQYTLTFAKSEPSPPEYLPVVPFTVTVLPISGGGGGTATAAAATTTTVNSLVQTPTVTVQQVQVDTIGYAINVPVVLSAPAANLMYLTISTAGDVNGVLAVQPQRVLISAGVTQVYF